MKAYVINLADRTDRWESVLNQSQFIPYEIERFEASNSSSFQGLDALLPAAVLACFDSHRKLLADFLKTDQDYALVLEDDFMVNRFLQKEEFERLLALGFDFLQIGFLSTTIFQKISIVNKNVFDSFYKCGAKLIGLHLPPAAHRFLKSKTIFKEQVDISWKIVLHVVRPGTHAYLISRKLASTIQTINSPTFLSADGLYIALGPLRSFRMGRLRKNLVSQSESPSSIL